MPNPNAALGVGCAAIWTFDFGAVISDPAVLAFDAGNKVMPAVWTDVLCYVHSVSTAWAIAKIDFQFPCLNLSVMIQGHTSANSNNAYRDEGYAVVHQRRNANSIQINCAVEVYVVAREGPRSSPDLHRIGVGSINIYLIH